MSLTAVDVVLIAAAYLLGSISSAIVVSRLMGLPDPRTQGSGNPGATNMLRVGGKTAAFITLLGDFAKGAVPVAAAHVLQLPLAVLCGAGLAAFLGHLYPVFFGFRGGKGVATALGVLVAGAWQVGLATIATWLLVFGVTRVSSLSALTAFVLAPLYGWWLVREPVFTFTLVVITLLLVWRHRSNIRKLLAGTEGRSKLS